jgi:hypothetical protein
VSTTQALNNVHALCWCSGPSAWCAPSSTSFLYYSWWNGLIFTCTHSTEVFLYSYWGWDLMIERWWILRLLSSGVAPYSLVHRYQRFGAAGSSETLVRFFQMWSISLFKWFLYMWLYIAYIMLVYVPLVEAGWNTPTVAPANRRRRRKWNPLPGRIIGPPCHWGT